MSDLTEILKTVVTKLGSLRDVKQRGWALLFKMSDGEFREVELAEVAQVLLHNPKFGTLIYGQAPGGKPWDQWSFHENGGGGSCTIPYFFTEGVLYIGMLKQHRPLQSDEPVWNIPRGFLQGGDHGETAQAEFQEETGILQRLDFSLLEGAGVDPNSAFFETWVKDEGVRFFRVCFPESLLLRDEKTGYYVLKSGVKPLAQTESFFGGLTFLPLSEASMVGDAFSLAAIGRLVAQGFDTKFHE